MCVTSCSRNSLVILLDLILLTCLFARIRFVSVPLLCTRVCRPVLRISMLFFSPVRTAYGHGRRGFGLNGRRGVAVSERGPCSSSLISSLSNSLGGSVSIECINDR